MATMSILLVVLLTGFGFALIIVYKLFNTMRISPGARDRDRQIVLHHFGLDIRVSGGRWFPIRYASQKRFNSFVKYVPWEASGYLWLRKDEAVLLVKPPREHPLEYRFNLRDVRQEWIGINIMKNGAFAWFSLSDNYYTHYLTSETGFSFTNSESTTQEIYDALREAVEIHRRWTNN